MNALGWRIRSIHLPESEWISGIETKYVLDSKPLGSTNYTSIAEPGKSLPSSTGDWYVEQHGPRPKQQGEVPNWESLPLFPDEGGKP